MSVVAMESIELKGLHSVMSLVTLNSIDLKDLSVLHNRLYF
jgi:hypothetical protein